MRARIGLGLATETAHYITFGDAGVAGGTKNGPGTSCSNVSPNDVCPLDPSQVNPMYRLLTDGAGHRFRVDETTIFDFFVSLQGQY